VAAAEGNMRQAFPDLSNAEQLKHLRESGERAEEDDVELRWSTKDNKEGEGASAGGDCVHKGRNEEGKLVAEGRVTHSGGSGLLPAELEGHVVIDAFIASPGSVLSLLVAIRRITDLDVVVLLSSNRPDLAQALKERLDSLQRSRFGVIARSRPIGGKGVHLLTRHASLNKDALREAAVAKAVSVIMCRHTEGELDFPRHDRFDNHTVFKASLLSHFLMHTHRAVLVASATNHGENGDGGGDGGDGGDSNRAKAGAVSVVASVRVPVEQQQEEEEGDERKLGEEMKESQGVSIDPPNLKHQTSRVTFLSESEGGSGGEAGVEGAKGGAGRHRGSNNSKSSSKSSSSSSSSDGATADKGAATMHLHCRCHLNRWWWRG